MCSRGVYKLVHCWKHSFAIQHFTLVQDWPVDDHMREKVGLALGTAEALETVNSAIDAASIYWRPIQAAEKFYEEVAKIIFNFQLIELCRYGATRSG